MALAEMVEYLRHSPPSQTSPAADRPILDGQTILLVEEQPIILRHLQKALEAAGAEVLMAHTAAEALPRIEQFDVSAAVLDWDPDCESRTLDASSAGERGGVYFLRYSASGGGVATRRGPRFCASRCGRTKSSRRSHCWSKVRERERLVRGTIASLSCRPRASAPSRRPSPDPVGTGYFADPRATRATR